MAPVSPSALWAHVWLAEELGYYKEENLDVEIVSNLSGGAVENALMLGDLDFGGVNQSRLIPFRADKGEDVIKIFAPESKFVFRVMVAADSPVQTARDLVGKTIGINEAGGDEDNLAVMLNSEGIKRDQYKTLAVGGRATAGVALQSDRVDAYMGSYVDQDAIVRSGVQVREIEIGDTKEFYNSGIAASTETLETRRDLAVRYGRAIAKAMIWEHENPEATIDILAEAVPEQVQDRAGTLALLKASNAINRPLFDARLRTDPAVWQTMITGLTEAGVIDQALSPDSIVTNDLLDDIWNFDVAAVTAAARGNDRS
ncbi:ABC transporter substrate-binding protein [Nonomuraea antimicrobica]|uniref:ABC transporter substrate-binding protein n=1 Tax=Nonomuraea antimicrobica TaxID=561173 RepID=UPI0031EBA07E